MIDINAIITEALNTAVAAAVTEATKPLLARIEALENNPAIGTDTALAARVKAIEDAPNALSAAAFVTYLDQQEWFWEKINTYIVNHIAGEIEEAMNDHCSNYDHDAYDAVVDNWGSEDPTDFVKDDDFKEQINDVLSNASFEVRIST